MFQKSKTAPKLDCEKLIDDPVAKNNYKTKVSRSFLESEEPNNNQERWDKVVNICLDAAKETVGHKSNKKQVGNSDLKR